MASKKDPEFTLKLIIDPKSRRVVLAEACKDVVDFIFSLLYMPLPMASIVKLLANEHTVGSMGSIYNSVESIAETYLECSQAKNLILSPTFVSPSKFLTGSTSTTTTYGKYYRCTNCCNYCTDMKTTCCPGCYHCTDTELKYVGSNSDIVAAEAAINACGFAKGVGTYIVMDDLTVMPVSNITSVMALLNKFDIKDASLLEERSRPVKFGTKEGLELLKASLQSKTVLTDVFLGMKAET